MYWVTCRGIYVLATILQTMSWRYVVEDVSWFLCIGECVLTTMSWGCVLGICLVTYVLANIY